MRAAGKPAVTLVGAGRLGATLGHQLRLQGYPIVTVSCLTEISARRAAGFIGEGRPVVFPGESPIEPAELVLLCVPDDEIEDAARALADQGGDWSRSVVLHTSGRLTSEALAPLRDRGARAGSIHPLQAFPFPVEDPRHLEGVFFSVEGDPRAVAAARRIVQDLGGYAFAVPPDAKPLYHAAASLASNGMVACLALAIHLLMECGLDGDEARQALLPLLRGTARNLEEAGPRDALTGPVARGDVETVESHLEALRELPDRVVLDAYRALSLVLVDLAIQDERIGAVEAARLRKLLAPSREDAGAEGEGQR